eukprot:2423441-Prymnesium_polylepis.1
MRRNLLQIRRNCADARMQSARSVRLRGLRKGWSGKREIDSTKCEGGEECNGHMRRHGVRSAALSVI